MTSIFFLALSVAAAFFLSCDFGSGGSSLPKKTSDWLFLFYFDADDDVLNDDMYKNIREIEYALSQMRKPDGSPSGNYPSVTALVLWDGQKALALKNAVDGFSDALLDLKNGDAQQQALFQKVFDDYVDQDPINYSKCKGLSYHGTYAFLSDLGDLALRVKNEPSLSDLHSSAGALLALLKHGDDNLIVYAWAGKMGTEENSPLDGKWKSINQKQLYLTGAYDYVSGDTVSVDRNEDVYGLTIAGCAVSPNTDDDITENYDKWVGFSAKWGDVIKAWKAYYEAAP